jgi:hypothetical protein
MTQCAKNILQALDYIEFLKIDHQFAAYHKALCCGRWTGQPGITKALPRSAVRTGEVCTDNRLQGMRPAD